MECSCFFIFLLDWIVIILSFQNFSFCSWFPSLYQCTFIFFLLFNKICAFEPIFHAEIRIASHFASFCPKWSVQFFTVRLRFSFALRSLRNSQSFSSQLLLSLCAYLSASSTISPTFLSLLKISDLSFSKVSAPSQVAAEIIKCSRPLTRLQLAPFHFRSQFSHLRPTPAHVSKLAQVTLRSYSWNLMDITQLISPFFFLHFSLYVVNSYIYLSFALSAFF